jgi:hypothetical protein
VAEPADVADAADDSPEAVEPTEEPAVDAEAPAKPKRTRAAKKED